LALSFRGWIRSAIRSRTSSSITCKAEVW
jgi:hypothetical protein